MYRLTIEPSSTSLFGQIARSVNPNHKLLEEIQFEPFKMDILIHVMIQAVGWRINALVFHWQYQTIKARVLEFVRLDPYCLDQADHFQGDYDVVMASVTKAGDMLRWASEPLRANYDIVLAAVSSYGDSIRWAPDNIRNIENIAKASVQQNGDSLKWLDKNSRTDPSIVLLAVQQDGMALYWADEELKNDSVIVLEAIKEEPDSFIRAGETARDTSEIVLSAVRRRGELLRWAGPNSTNSTRIVEEAMKKKSCMHLRWASDTLKDNFEIVLKAVGKQGNLLRWAGPNSQNEYTHSRRGYE